MDSFGDYLKEIGRHPLLTGAQEIELSRKIARAYELRMLGVELTKEQMREVRRGDLAKTRLVNSNLRLVVHIAKRYRSMVRSMEIMDLVQEGTFGLVRAAEMFDGSKGYKFSTYAYWWVRQAVQRAMDTKERVIRIPVHISEKLGKLKKLKHELGMQLGRKATKAELAEALDVSVEKLDEMLVRGGAVVSLDQFTKCGDGDSTISDVLADKGYLDDGEQLQQIDQAKSYEAVLECLDMLQDTERFVMKCRLGFEDRKPMTLVGLSEELGMSKERVRQIQEKATYKLHRLVRGHKQFV